MPHRSEPIVNPFKDPALAGLTHVQKVALRRAATRAKHAAMDAAKNAKGTKQ